MKSSEFADKLLALVAEARQAGLDDDELANLLDDTAKMLDEGINKTQAAVREHP